MSDARQPSRPGSAPPAKPGAKTPAETSQVVGETVVAPPPGAPAPSPRESAPSTIIMAGGPYAGLLGPPEVDGELGRLGGYAVLKELGRGGMGLVFEAEDPKLRRKVALKVMLPEFAKQPEAKERFLREARSAAAVEHENVVPVYQVGEEFGVPFLAMRMLPGESVADLLARKGSLPAVSVAGLGRQAALGLAAAHERGLIHRDIKPGNLWVEPGGRVRVLDFGLARPQEAAGELTRSGAVVGTPEYLAPEQLRGEDLDGRADLFSLGAVLYRAATGTSPFRRDTLYGTLKAVESEAPPDPRSLRPDLPAPLAELILRLLAKDRNHRPANAAAAAKSFKELGPLLAKGGESLTGPPQAERAEVSQTAVLAKDVADRPLEKLIGAAQGPLTPTAMPTAFPVFEPPPVLPSRAKLPPRPKLPPRKGTATKTKAWWGRQPPWKNRNVLLAAGGGFLGLLGVIFAIMLSTRDATLRIEGLDPDMKVEVTEGGELVRIIDQTTGAVAELDPGTYELTLKGGDAPGLTATLKENSIILSRGDERVVEIVKTSKAEAASGDGAAEGPQARGGRSALRFDGVDDEVRTPVALSGTSDFTIEAWIVAEKPSQYSPAIGNRWIKLRTDENGKGGYQWSAVLGALDADGREGRRGWAVDTPVVTNRRVHVALVRRGAELRAYVDGRGDGFPMGWGEAGYKDASFPVPPLPLVIGFDGHFQRFTGTIDEVRISSAARYSGNFTPEKRFEPDAQTLALYHFDEGQGDILKDASGNGSDAKIVDAKWVAESAGDLASQDGSAQTGATAGGAALDFDGKASYVRLPSLKPPAGPLTIEAWVAPRTAPTPAIIAEAGGATRAGLFQYGGRAAFLFADANQRTAVREDLESEQPQAAPPLHLAGVWDGTRVWLFVNGRPSPAAPAPPGAQFGGPELVESMIGAKRNERQPDAFVAMGFFDGVIDEVRYSKSVRYTSDFTPQRRFSPDGDTLALYHFDDGEGTVAKDASGNGHDGTIIGAKWVAEPTLTRAGGDGFLDLLADPNLAGWTVLKIPGGGPASPGDWLLKNGVLGCATRNPSWVRYDRQLGDFALELEFFLPAGGNSGVLIRHSGEEPLPQHGMEVQIYDAPTPDTYPADQITGSIYKAVPASPKDRLKRADWNRMSIVCRGEQVAVTLNGMKVVDAAMDKVPALKDRPRSGYIGFYSHDGSAAGTMFRNVRLRDLSAPAAVAVAPEGGEADGWVSLFDGKTLDGWQRKGGTNTFEVTDGTIVGSTVAGARNTFLCTTKDYADFELELEVKLLRDDINSGVQIRGHSRPGFKNGLVHGPQVEIERSGWHAGLLYGEQTVGWIPPGSANRTTTAIKNTEWNLLRVRAVGPHVETWINGQKIADVSDPATNPQDPGFIGLQMHDYAGPHPAQVQWRNIRIRELASSGEAAGIATAPTNDWLPLFDGKTLEGWVRKEGSATFDARDGAIVGSTAAGSPNSYLCTTKDYGDFELEFDVKLLRDDLNGGVQIRSHSRPDIQGGVVHGPQVEIESSPGRSGHLYGEKTIWRWVQPQGVSGEPQPTSAFKNGEWNRFRVLALGPRVETSVNGKPVTVVTHPADTNPADPGFIALQVQQYSGSHPAQVMWRNIRIRELASSGAALASAFPPLDEAWVKKVAALPPEGRSNEILAELKRRNPAFAGRFEAVVEGGRVSEAKLFADGVADLTPLQALPELTRVSCHPAEPGKSESSLTDLSPLRGLRLVSLDISFCKVADLAPVAGMPLEAVDISINPVADLSPLRGAPLRSLKIHGTEIGDLGPLAGMKLQEFVGGGHYEDISPLKGMPLKSLELVGPPVRDISALKGAPLENVVIRTPVLDFRPLMGAPVKRIALDEPERHVALLRSFPSLETINDKPAAEFLKAAAP